jgi:GDPmannose 4,6-dehydratase
VHETKWDQLCTEMVAADLIAVAQEQRRNAE